MRLNTVVKVGGSLCRGKGLVALCGELGSLGKRRPVLIVPGGGEFADLVRISYRRYNLGETAAHCMALLAMDQYGYLLNRLIEGSSLEADPVSARQTAESGRVAIFLPSATVIRVDPLPHSWEVTSDTIAAWTACELSCRRLVLLKDVDGLIRSRSSETKAAEIIDTMTVEQLAGHNGGVDGYLPNFLKKARLETWVVNGLKPGRISELLDSGTATGTRIIPPGD
jgi:aspartokinase-like uncharacterized kinase